MLRFLRIRRLAVIHSVEVEFDPGLNVLTGETGAGKSILVEAVGLLLGGRASGDLVRTGEESAVVEAIFENAGTELLVRREITAQGRSRAFVNGELTTVGALKDLSSQLIELHGQHEHHTLLDPARHLDLLDDFGALDRFTTPVAEAFAGWREAATALVSAKSEVVDRAARQELVAFQLGELDRAGLRDGEDEELAGTRQILASADRVERLCEEAYASLYDQDKAVLATLAGIWRRVSELAALDPRFQVYLDSRDAITSQLDDLARFLRRYADSIEASPAKLQQIEDRLALLERLKRKYGPTLPDVMARRNGLRAEVERLDQTEERLADLERLSGRARARYLEAANALSGARRELAAKFARDLERTLADLAMERTRFEVRFADRLSDDSWTASGIDQAEFFVSPNPGEELRPLARIVSGGELSRIMLALKTLTAASRQGFSDTVERAPSAATPGLIFDEVDAGIGGRVADVVGRKLRVLGSAFQVLCITHLPQIAAYADTHFLIEKSVEQGRTATTVVRLDESARVEEISRMLGGAGVTEGIKASAREMLAERRGAKAKGEMKPKGESESPGRKGARIAMARKYLIETFGCQMNVHDSERMAGLLEQAGFESTDDAADADVVVINTCSVREHAEAKLYTRLGELRVLAAEGGHDPIVAVAGCVAQQEGHAILRRSGGTADIVVGTQAIRRLPMLVEQAERAADTRHMPFVDLHGYDDVSFPLGVTRRADPVKAYITIIEGCNEFCSFCVVPYTRGNERMRPKADILAEVREAVDAGHWEVQLLGQIVNHYDAPDDDHCDFTGLLEAIHEVSGLERIRFASPHPRHVSARFLAAMSALPKICRHLHLPVQSGSTRVLEAMRRRYTRESYLDLVGRIRESLPDVALSTDMIVGFPGETDDDFAQTLSLTAAVRYHSMFSFKYSPRPNTLAGKRFADDVPDEEKTRRIVALQAAQRDIQVALNADLVGREVDVLVDAASRRRDTDVSGRTSQNIVVNMPGPAAWLGRTVAVRIARAGAYSVWGQAVNHAD